VIEPEFQVNIAIPKSFPNDKMIEPECQVNQIRKLTPLSWGQSREKEKSSGTVFSCNIITST